MSKGETKLAEMLTAADLYFVREKTFNDLKHGILRYDFFVDLPGLGGACVEIDGEHHFQFVKAFYKNNLEWRHALEHDRIKNSYCLAHDIPLIRIPYWKFSEVNCVDDLLKPEFRVKTRWHNDNLDAPKK